MVKEEQMCKGCTNIVYGKKMKFDFFVEGIPFKLKETIDGTECGYCAMYRLTMKYREYAKIFINSKRVPEINWELYRMYETRYEKYMTARAHFEILDLLIAAKILSIGDTGKYNVWWNNSMIVNPNTAHGDMLSFNRLIDARAWAKIWTYGSVRKIYKPSKKKTSLN